MKARELMSSQIATCRARSPLADVANMMRARHCGAIPVLDDEVHRRPVGIVTDRDIVARLVAVGRDAARCTAGDAMTPVAVTVGTEADANDVRLAMRDARIRRVVVIDDAGACVGMISLADLARSLPDAPCADLLRAVSTSGREAGPESSRTKDDSALDEALRETFPASDPVALAPDPPSRLDGGSIG